MSVDEKLLHAVVEAAAKAKLEFVFVGNAAAALHDVPITTQALDLFVRYTPLNLQKIRRCAELLGGSVAQPYDPVSRMMRVVTEEVSVDFIFDLSSRKKFESLRSRAARMTFGKHSAMVAALEDVIAAKEAAGRPKDKATLPILKAALRTKKEMEKETE